jgi:hypothetical protein
LTHADLEVSFCRNRVGGILHSHRRHDPGQEAEVACESGGPGCGFSKTESLRPRARQSFHIAEDRVRVLKGSCWQGQPGRERGVRSIGRRRQTSCRRGSCSVFDGGRGERGRGANGHPDGHGSGRGVRDHTGRQRSRCPLTASRPHDLHVSGQCALHGEVTLRQTGVEAARTSSADTLIVPWAYNEDSHVTNPRACGGLAPRQFCGQHRDGRRQHLVP